MSQVALLLFLDGQQAFTSALDVHSPNQRSPRQTHREGSLFDRLRDAMRFSNWASCNRFLGLDNEIVESVLNVEEARLWPLRF